MLAFKTPRVHDFPWVFSLEVFPGGFPSRAWPRDTFGHASKTNMKKSLQELKVALTIDKGILFS
jgi:hypothetical protein